MAPSPSARNLPTPQEPQLPDPREGWVGGGAASRASPPRPGAGGKGGGQLGPGCGSRRQAGGAYHRRQAAAGKDEGWRINRGWWM